MKFNILASKDDRDDYLIASTVRSADMEKHLEDKRRKAFAWEFVKGVAVAFPAGVLTGVLIGLAW